MDLKSHLLRQWPNASIERFRWQRGPIETVLPGFGVYRVVSDSRPGIWLYVSDGASRVPSAEGNRHEYFLMSPVESPQHVETLAMLAHYSVDFDVHVGRVIDLGQPWLEGSAMQHLLVSLPYPYGPSLEVFGNVRILWLLPITAPEAAYAKKHGTEALEALFDQAHIDALDPFRNSVACEC